MQDFFSQMQVLALHLSLKFEFFVHSVLAVTLFVLEIRNTFCCLRKLKYLQVQDVVSFCWLLNYITIYGSEIAMECIFCVYICIKWDKTLEMLSLLTAVLYFEIVYTIIHNLAHLQFHKAMTQLLIYCR